MERVSPRVFRLVALPSETERQKTQLYAQRYVEQLPAGGEIVIFDRSWYNRAGVEQVMGFCARANMTNNSSRSCPRSSSRPWLVSSGIILLKYWLDVWSEKVQAQALRGSHRGSDETAGSSAPWTWNRIAAGTIIHVRRDAMLSATRHAHVSLDALCPIRRQEARTAQHHQPPAQPDTVRATRATRT